MFLVLITAVVACASGRLLWEFGGYENDYAEALHDGAMSTLTGVGLSSRDPFAQGLEIVLAAYSVVIIAAIAAALADYFLGRATVLPWARETAAGEGP